MSTTQKTKAKAQLAEQAEAPALTARRKGKDGRGTSAGFAPGSCCSLLCPTKDEPQVSQTCYHGPGRAGGAQHLFFSFPLQGPHEAGSERGTEVLGPGQTPVTAPTHMAQHVSPLRVPRSVCRFSPRSVVGCHIGTDTELGSQLAGRGCSISIPPPLAGTSSLLLPARLIRESNAGTDKQRLQRDQWHRGDPQKRGWMRMQECLATSPESQGCWKCRAQCCREL